MSRHQFFKGKQYSTSNLSDEEEVEEEWENSWDNSVSPTSRSYLVGFQSSQQQQHEQEDVGDSELLSKCLEQLHSTINTSSYTEEELTDALRRSNYSISAAIQLLPTATGGADDLLFGFEDNEARPKANNNNRNNNNNNRNNNNNNNNNNNKSWSAQNQNPSQIAVNLQPRAAANTTAKNNKINPTNANTTVTSQLADITKTSAKTYGNDIEPFDFSTPSPDDRVLQAQSQAFQKKKESSPQPSRSPASPSQGQRQQQQQPQSPQPKRPFQGKTKMMGGADQTKQTLSTHETKSTDTGEESMASPRLGLASPSTVSKEVARAAEKKLVPQHGEARRNQILKIIQDEEKDDLKKAHINLVVIGHVDAGKSTLMGHLLVLCGVVSKKTINKYERDSKTIGKNSFHFAWVLDEHAEERERGVTIDVCVTSFETKSKKVTLLDAPGHRDFVPNMISGAAQADVAILVINASEGEFERGFKEDGQTREHVILAKSLGVTSLIVAINKLDLCGWSEPRYKELISALSPFLTRTGFPSKLVTYVPVSGLAGDNLIHATSAELKSWYNGPTLIETIDGLEPPPRPVTLSCRFVMSNVYKDTQTGMGICVGGKVESGFIAKKDQLLVLPINELCTVKQIKTSHGDLVDFAPAGSNVELALLGVEMNMLPVGCILCDPMDQVPLVTSFKAKIITFNPQPPLLRGTQLILHMQSVSQPAVLKHILGILDMRTGEVKQKKPKCLAKQVSANVVITLERGLCMELFSSCKPLGRFTLRDSGKTLGAGVVTKILSTAADASK